MTNELKQGPFCEELDIVDVYIQETWFVKCKGCDNRIVPFKSLKQAISDLNERAIAAEVKNELNQEEASK